MPRRRRRRRGASPPVYLGVTVVIDVLEAVQLQRTTLHGAALAAATKYGLDPAKPYRVEQSLQADGVIFYQTHEVSPRDTAA